ncbi:MAG: hypothetical protein AAGJ37_12840 [Pseudomonadota bacterium]
MIPSDLKLLPKVAQCLLLCIAALFSPLGSACEYHGLNFGVFGMQSDRQSVLAARPPALEVTHPLSVDVATSEQKSVRVRYYQPDAYKNIEISIGGSEDINIISSGNISLNKLFGAFDLSFESLSKGEHQIELAIKGLLNGRPFFQVHKMTVISD